MGNGLESSTKPNSEHASKFTETDPRPIVASKKKFQTPSQYLERSVMGETDCEVVTENSVVVSKSSSAAAASEFGFEARNSMVVSKSSSHGDNNNSSSQCHVCRFCNKVFRSGKALGGHVRIHAAGRSNGQSSCRGIVSKGDCSSTDIWVKKFKVPTSRSNGNSNWIRADSIEGLKAEEAEEDFNIVRNMIMDFGQEESSDRKMVSLYALRRNPKRSRKLTDEEFSTDLIAKNSRACVQCGKEFPSSKALFGHMRCHPERDWRGTQPPNDNTNSTDDDSQYNTTGGDTVVYASSSGFSSVCLQSSQGSEDLEENWDQEAAVSDVKSNRERMKGGKAAHQPASCSLLSWSVTAKRGRRRPTRCSQPQQDDDDAKEEEVEINRELEDDRDTAHFLVMLASSAIDTNDTRHVERKMTDESVYNSKTGKRELQGRFEELEAAQEDLGWKEKREKRMTDKTSRPFESVAGLAGKYKCSTCKKLFNTHQALGGHRSSHRKVKGCSAIEEVTEEEITEEGSSVLMTEYHPTAVDEMDSREEEKRASLTYLTREQSAEPVIKVKNGQGHECCICRRVFSSGQALGGHKRSHGTADKFPESANNITSQRNDQSY